jgi:hypothetical protein
MNIQKRHFFIHVHFFRKTSFSGGCNVDCDCVGVRGTDYVGHVCAGVIDWWALMKTNTDVAMIALVLVVLSVIALAVFSAGQVSLAAAQVNAEAAAGQLPLAAVVGGQLSGWALSSLIGIVVLAVASGLAAWARRWWVTRDGRRSAWRSGPNARWQGLEVAERAARGPRSISSDEWMRMMLMQQMMSATSQDKSRRASQQMVDDDLNIRF